VKNRDNTLATQRDSRPVSASGRKHADQ